MGDEFVMCSAELHADLLAACKDYLSDLRNNSGTWSRDRLEKLIEKAEGKS